MLQNFLDLKLHKGPSPPLDETPYEYQLLYVYAQYIYSISTDHELIYSIQFHYLPILLVLLDGII